MDLRPSVLDKTAVLKFPSLTDATTLLGSHSSNKIHFIKVCHRDYLEIFVVRNLANVGVRGLHEDSIKN